MHTLHTYRFTGEHATLSVVETTDRTHVVMQMHGDSADFEEYAVTLRASQWRDLCGFEPFASHRGSADVLRAVRFCESEHGDMLEVSETYAGDGVMVEMRHALSTDPDDGLSMFMSPSQWRQLVALDVVGERSAGPAEASFYALASNGTIH